MKRKWFNFKIRKDFLLKVIPAFIVVIILIGFIIIGFDSPRGELLAKSDHIVDMQFESESDFVSVFNSGIYTYDEPKLVINPYKVSPLTALIMFETDTETDVTITVQGKDSDGDIVHTFEENTVHYLPIYGLYGNHSNLVTIALGTGETSHITVQTEPLPEDMVFPTEIDTTYEYMQDNMLFLTPASKGYTAAYDYNGEVRWYLDINVSWDLQRLDNGNILLGTDRQIADPYYVTGVYEMDLLGKVYNEFTLPGGYHHDIFEMDNGNFLVGSSGFLGTVEDKIYELDRTSGLVVKNWDLETILPHDEGKMAAWTESDWFHNNSIFYDNVNNSIILSGRHQDAVISIDYESGDLNWVIGDPENWPSQFVDEYFFTEVDSENNIGDQDFEWQYAQHSAKVLPNGDIFILDNGNNKSKIKENYVSSKDSYTRGVIYRINTSDMTIDQIWQYGKEEGYEFYSSYISNVEYYDENHYMIHSGGIGYIDGEIANFPPVLADKESEVILKSITLEVLNDEVVYKAVLPNNYYRAEKLELYYDDLFYELGKGNVLGTLGETKTTMNYVNNGFAFLNVLPKKYDLNLTLEKDRLIVSGSFETSDEIYLVLEGKDETKKYFVPTSRTPYTAMCIDIFNDEQRYITYYVNKDNLDDIYNIFFVINGKKYNTKYAVKFD